MAIKLSFSDLWATHLEAKALAAGAVDGDFQSIRVAARNVLVSAGWDDGQGALNFVSNTDLASCIKAAVEAVETSAHLASHHRLAARAQPVVGASATKAQVLSAYSMAEFTSAQKAPVASFSPLMAKPGDRCPRCSGSMEPVILVNDKPAVYCTKDRVVLPLSIDAQNRY